MTLTVSMMFCTTSENIVCLVHPVRRFVSISHKFLYATFLRSQSWVMYTL